METIKLPKLDLKKKDAPAGENKIEVILPYDVGIYGDIVTFDGIPEGHLFCWDEIPGKDSKKLIGFLTHKFGVDWVKKAQIEKNDDGKTIRVTGEKKYLSLELNDEQKYLFCWDKIPGNDSERFIDFLKQKFSIDWVKTAKIEKIDNDKTIKVLSEKNFIFLKLNNEKTKFNLKIDDGRTDEFISKTENNTLNIHERTKVNLEIDDGRTDEFNVKIESGRINIYPVYEELERYWVNEPFSFISILLNKTFDEYIYYIVEPQLTPFELTLLHDVYERSRDILSYEDLTEGVDKKALLTGKVKKIIDKYIHNFDVRSFYKILYFILRNNIGFGRIDPLINDELIEDISCSGPNIPVYLFHRKYENIKTSLVFEEEELNSFVFILAQQSGKNISVAKPYLDATLSDGSRLQETLGREITTRGSSFTIRKFKEEPSTPIDLIIWKTFNVEMMAYLWLAIENNKSLILAGGTASGKTTSLNSMSLFIPHKAKIVTLEDTREIQLFHENWVAGLTRESFTTGGKGTVDMYELLRQGLRQRPEYLIVGEVRGKEALTLFQAMSTGHTTYSTMHAGSIQAAINRLENEPINVPRVMITALDILCVQGATYLQGKRVRRILNVIEIVDLDPETRSLNTLETFTWNPLNDEHNELRESHVLESIREKRGWTKKQLEQALDRRKKVLAYMVDRNIRDYDSVVQIIKDFQISQEKLLKKLMIEE